MIGIEILIMFVLDKLKYSSIIPARGTFADIQTADKKAPDLAPLA